jgi:hypothetical protein
MGCWRTRPDRPYLTAMRRDPRNAEHLATISHDGLFWDAYLELAESQERGAPVRGRIAFSAAGEPGLEAVRTATIFVEDSTQDVLARARELKTHQLVGLLRSCAPGGAVEGGPAGDEPEPMS